MIVLESEGCKAEYNCYSLLTVVEPFPVMGVLRLRESKNHPLPELRTVVVEPQSWSIIGEGAVSRDGHPPSPREQEPSAPWTAYCSGGVTVLEPSPGMGILRLRESKNHPLPELHTVVVEPQSWRYVSLYGGPGPLSKSTWLKLGRPVELGSL
jgi:hypothetical protein